jgi:hypothetical protein
MAASVNASNNGNGLPARQPALQVVAPPPVATDPRPNGYTLPLWARMHSDAHGNPHLQH